MKDFWKYVKDYPYWERFKRDTYYYFHPIAYIKDAKRWAISQKESDLDYSYNKKSKEENENRNNYNDSNEST